MPRPPDIQGFAPKLRMALARGNISRAVLAKEVGIDKSVVARWLSGSVRPTEHRLVRLTQVIARRVPDFDMELWTLEEDSFHQRLRPPAALAPSPATGPGLLAASTQWAAAQGLDRAVSQYGGLWFFLYDSVRVARAFGLVGEFRPGPGVLDCEIRDDGNWHGRGPGWALNGKVWIALEEIQHCDSFGFGVFWGTSNRKAEMLDGLAMVREFAHTAAPGATHLVGFRLGDLLDDPAAARERWAACVARVGVLNLKGWEDLLPAELLARLPQSVQSGGTTMRLPAEQSLAISDFDLAAAEAKDGLRRRSLDLLRALFAGALGATR